MSKLRKSQIFLFGIIFFVIIVILYYFITVLAARKETPKIIADALETPEIILEVRDLSKEQLNILLKVEDPNFYHHKGIDFKTPGAGITTITQGLVKQYYYTHFKPGLAKIRQSLIARFALDPLIPKDTQLKLFINDICLGYVEGKPVYGFAWASEVYFGKPFKRLTTDEYIALVAMIIAPTTFNIKTHPDANANRVARIKLLISGKYKAKSLMDLYYGGKYYTKRNFLDKYIWGY